MRRLRWGIRIQWRGFCGAAALAALLAAQPALPAPAGAIDPETRVHLLQGRRDYRVNCAPCHGLDGVATLSYAPGFRAGVAVLPDAYFLDLMETGGFMMPPWRFMLSQEQRADIVTFVRHLSGGVLARQRCEHCHTVPPGTSTLHLAYPY